MKKEEIQRLDHGLYIIEWKTGGESLAAVGSMADGTRWLAPCNWIKPTTKRTVRKSWNDVESVILIRCA